MINNNKMENMQYLLAKILSDAWGVEVKDKKCFG